MPVTRSVRFTTILLLCLAFPPYLLGWLLGFIVAILIWVWDTIIVWVWSAMLSGYMSGRLLLVREETSN